MVSAWPEPPFASIAGVCDGLEVLALGGTTTESRPTRLLDLTPDGVAPNHAAIFLRQVSPMRTSTAHSAFDT
jgi:hypothetical protein